MQPHHGTLVNNQKNKPSYHEMWMNLRRPNLSERGQAEKAAYSIYAVGLDQYLFIYATLDGLLGCFQFFAHDKRSYYEHLSRRLCVDICLHFSWVNMINVFT